MAEPITVLELGSVAPDLMTSAYGPFVETPVERIEEIGSALDEQAYDAIVLNVDSPSQLADWTGLPRAVLDAAVVMVAPEPKAADALRMLQAGVQDVLSRREAGEVDTLARVVRLAVERKRAERVARRAYATDLATGLPHHAQLMEHITHLLALREREPAAMSLIVLAIDGLAATEARLGAEAANVLRRKVAVRLRAALRASDVVASVGVDTFAVLLAWIDEADDAPRVADKLVQSLRRPFSVAGQDVAVAVRLGLAQYPAHGRDAGALLGRAMNQAGAAPAVGRAGLSPRVGGAAANDE